MQKAVNFVFGKICRTGSKKKSSRGVVFLHMFLYANQTQVFESLISVALFISELYLF